MAPVPGPAHAAGTGVMTYPDGSTFEGQWVAGTRVKGKLVAGDGSWEYTGDWQGDQQHGQGLLFQVSWRGLCARALDASPRHCWVGGVWPSGCRKTRVFAVSGARVALPSLSSPFPNPCRRSCYPLAPTALPCPSSPCRRGCPSIPAALSAGSDRGRASASMPTARSTMGSGNPTTGTACSSVCQDSGVDMVVAPSSCACNHKPPAPLSPSFPAGMARARSSMAGTSTRAAGRTMCRRAWAPWSPRTATATSVRRGVIWGNALRCVCDLGECTALCV